MFEAITGSKVNFIFAAFFALYALVSLLTGNFYEALLQAIISVTNLNYAALQSKVENGYYVERS